MRRTKRAFALALDHTRRAGKGMGGTRRHLFLAATCLLGGGGKDLKAAVFHWDGTSTSANADGGSGTWNTTLTNWTNAASGGSNVAWGNANADDAVFGGVGGTVTVGTITANDLTFISGDYLLTGGRITLRRPGAADNPTMTVADGVSATIASTLAGTRNIAKEGAGTLVLSGANTFSGVLTVSAGTLNIRHASALGTTGGETAVSAGATLQVQGGITTAEAITLNGTGVGATGALRNMSGANTITGAITLGAASLIRSDSGLLTLSGSITGTNASLTFDGAGDILLKTGSVKTGSATLLKTGTGTLTLQGTTDATGTAFEAREGLAIFDYSRSNTNRVGNSATLTFSGGTIGVTGGSGPETLASTAFTRGASKLIRMTGDTGTSSIRLNALTRRVGATFDVNGNALADTDTVNINGIIGGWFTLAGADFASNATSADGPLLAATYTNDTWAAANNTTVTASGTLSGATTNSLRFNGPAAATLALSGTNTIASGGLLVTSNVGARDTTLTGGILRGAAAGDLIVHQHNTGGALIIASTVADNGGATALTKSGAGRLVLSGDNTFTGAVYLNEGEMVITSLADGGSASSLGASAKAASNLVLQNGATLAYAGSSDAATDRAFTAAGSGVTIASNGTGRLSFTNSAGVAFDTPHVNRTLALSGTNAGDNVFTLTLGDNGTAKTSLIKNGIGKWVLTSVSAYTGTTLVNEGTLVQNGSAAGSAHTVNTGATLGGAGTVGAVTLNNGGTLAPGSTGGALGTLSVTGDLTWNGGGVMRFDLGAAGASDRLNLTGALTKGTGGAYSMDFGGTGEAGVYTLITGASASNFTADQFTYSNLRTGMSGLFSFAGSNLIFTVAPPTAVPEPQEYALAGGALAALAAGVRRARRRMKIA